MITVEILERHLKEEKAEGRTPIDWLRAKFTGEGRRDKSMRETIKYLEHWGKKFWIETEYRVKEITQEIETKLGSEASAVIGVLYASLGASLRGGVTLTDTERAELRTRAQKVVSEAQIEDLHKVGELLDVALEGRQKRIMS